jgi:hypothetical protein
MKVAEEYCWEVTAVPERLRRVGRPHARWRDEVGKDARMLGIRSWWATAMD